MRKSVFEAEAGESEVSNTVAIFFRVQKAKSERLENGWSIKNASKFSNYSTPSISIKFLSIFNAEGRWVELKIFLRRTPLSRASQVPKYFEFLYYPTCLSNCFRYGFDSSLENERNAAFRSIISMKKFLTNVWQVLLNIFPSWPISVLFEYTRG